MFQRVVTGDISLVCVWFDTTRTHLYLLRVKIVLSKESFKDLNSRRAKLVCILYYFVQVLYVCHMPCDY